ncbi:radical SAM protein [Streptomyces inhibens]|uniref:radical SAM protein n=1 Tax=Streptomyces inhibens TaxID=2293571 RepID=UPI0015F26EEE|nr:radical SAM protein [Streptomyces inhibens]
MYTTFRCNMRCRHCFIGDLLDSPVDLDWGLLEGFLKTARARWGSREVAYLGGEPTLYPHLGTAITLAQQLDYRVRVVSNGGAPLRRLVSSRPGGSPFHVAVSFDGSAPGAHDGVRQRGSFAQAVRSVETARAHGHTVSGILSVGRHNRADALGTLRLLAQLGLDHVNVHYVSNRGFAGRDLPMPVRDWLALRAQVREMGLAIPLRYERAFARDSRPLDCAVENGSELMLFPDGRVFQCSMFLGSHDGHSHRWDGTALVPNPSFALPRHQGSGAGRHCPAMAAINGELCAEAEAAERHVACIFDKENLGAARGEKEKD